MKKKLITIIIGMVFCIGWIGGCASKEINHDNVATSVTEESKQEGVKKEKLPTATYMEETILLQRFAKNSVLRELHM